MPSNWAPTTSRGRARPQENDNVNHVVALSRNIYSIFYLIGGGYGPYGGYGPGAPGAMDPRPPAMDLGTRGLAEKMDWPSFVRSYLWT